MHCFLCDRAEERARGTRDATRGSDWLYRVELYSSRGHPHFTHAATHKHVISCSDAELRYNIELRAFVPVEQRLFKSVGSSDGRIIHSPSCIT